MNQLSHELQYIIDFLSQSYPDATDKEMHEQAKDRIIKIKKALTGNDNVPDMEFINKLDGLLCDAPIIDSMGPKNRDSQDVLQEVVKDHYNFDIYNPQPKPPRQ